MTMLHNASRIQSTITMFTDMLRPHCAELIVAGSVRRGKQDVKDVELCALPHDTLLPLLDSYARDGVVQKALYGTTVRWGAVYRGMVFNGVRFELFCYDADNRGYQVWLRTGPYDANIYAMTMLGNREAEFGFKTYGYYGLRINNDQGKREFVPDQSRKLSIRTEDEMFTLLGLPYFPPQERSLACYERLMGRSEHRFGDPSLYLIKKAGRQKKFSDVSSAWTEVDRLSANDDPAHNPKLEEGGETTSPYAVRKRAERLQWFTFCQEIMTYCKQQLMVVTTEEDRARYTHALRYWAYQRHNVLQELKGQ